MIFRKYLPIISLFLFAVLILFSFYKFTKSQYLTFSDSAKMAEVGKSLVEGTGFGTKFILFSNHPELNTNGLFSARVIPPLAPYLIAESFKIFGVTDTAVIGVSTFFYVVLVLATYLSGKKFWGSLVGFLAAVAVAVDINFLSYAVTGASETLFTAEIIIVLLLFTNKKIWSDIVGFGVLIAMYLTKPHAILYMATMFFYFIQLKTCNYKKTIKIYSLVILAGLIIVGLGFVIPGLTFSKLLLERILVSVSSNSAFAPANNVLRINESALGPLIVANLIPILKKLFYNLYNFYKLLPNIFSPYLIALFVIALLRPVKDKIEKAFKITTVATIIIIFFVNAITIPLYRYLHPLMPLVYLLAIAELINIVRGIATKGRNVIFASGILVFFFVVGQSLGYIFLDSRFTNKTVNKDQPPVYVELAKILRDNTKSSDIVVTNLDTWGSWYGERRTIWYPLEPSQLGELDPKKVSVDAIYLTSYLMDDENNYMGSAWRQIFGNPTKIQDHYIAENFKLKTIFNIDASSDYEHQGARAILLVRK